MTRYEAKLRNRANEAVKALKGGTMVYENDIADEILNGEDYMIYVYITNVKKLGILFKIKKEMRSGEVLEHVVGLDDVDRIRNSRRGHHRIPVGMLKVLVDFLRIFESKWYGEARTPEFTYDCGDWILDSMGFDVAYLGEAVEQAVYKITGYGRTVDMRVKVKGGYIDYDVEVDHWGEGLGSDTATKQIAISHPVTDRLEQYLIKGRLPELEEDGLTRDLVDLIVGYDRQLCERIKQYKSRPCKVFAIRDTETDGADAKAGEADIEADGAVLV